MIMSVGRLKDWNAWSHSWIVWLPAFVSSFRSGSNSALEGHCRNLWIAVDRGASVVRAPGVRCFITFAILWSLIIPSRCVWFCVSFAEFGDIGRLKRVVFGSWGPSWWSSTLVALAMPIVWQRLGHRMAQIMFASFCIIFFNAEIARIADTRWVHSTSLWDVPEASCAAAGVLCHDVRRLSAFKVISEDPS